MIEKTMCARLKEIRKLLGYSQKEFAGHLNITQQSYSLLEKGKRSLNINIIKHLSKHYLINLNWLVNGYGEIFLREESAARVDETPVKNAKDFCKIHEDIERRFKFYLRTIEKIFLEESTKKK